MIAVSQPEPQSLAAGSTEPVVASLQRVVKNYGQVKALRQFDMNLRQGEIVALLGPNGAGKTTAVKLLLGLARADAGQVTVFGNHPRSAAAHVRVGAMLQVARVPETLRVEEHIDLFSSYYPRPLPMSETLALAGLHQIRQRKFGDLSGGQRQRVLFALAVCGDPDLLFLDEPTVGLDVEVRRALWDEVRIMASRGKTVLLTTHYLEEADALASRVLVIDQGRIIAEGSPSQIKARTAGRRIRCLTRLADSFVSALPGVQSVCRDRGTLEIRTAAPESVLRILLAEDPHLSGIEVTAGGLEEAFLALTRKDIA
jgi:ABC-2 type transport system ATP-binding protein